MLAADRPTTDAPEQPGSPRKSQTRQVIGLVGGRLPWWMPREFVLRFVEAVNRELMVRRQSIELRYIDSSLLERVIHGNDELLLIISSGKEQAGVRSIGLMLTARLHGKAAAVLSTRVPQVRPTLPGRWWNLLELKLAQEGVSSQLPPFPVDLHGIEFSLRDQLQPKIVCCTDRMCDAECGAIVRAVALVKQKYPRTELDLLFDAGCPLPKISCSSFVRVIPVRDAEERKAAFAASDLLIAGDPDEHRAEIGIGWAAGIPVVGISASLGRDDQTVDGMIRVPRYDWRTLHEQILGLIEQPGRARALSESGWLRSRRLSAEYLASGWADALVAVLPTADSSGRS